MYGSEQTNGAAGLRGASLPGGSIGGGPSDLATVQRAPGGEVANALNRQEKATHELSAAVHALGERLAPVIAPSPEKEQRDPQVGHDYGSQIATCVQLNTERVEAVTRQIARLIHDLAI